MDLDGDQRVDFHEFYAATINYKALFSDTSINNLYAILDTRTQGKISMQNFRLQLPTSLNRTGELSLRG